MVEKKGDLLSKNNLTKMAMGIVIIGGVVLTGQQLGLIGDKPLSGGVGEGVQSAEVIKTGAFCSTDNGVQISAKVTFDNLLLPYIQF